MTGLLPSYGQAKRRKVLQVRIGVEYRDLGSPAALAVSRRSSPMYEDNPLSVRPVNWWSRGDSHSRPSRCQRAALLLSYDPKMAAPVGFAPTAVPLQRRLDLTTLPRGYKNGGAGGNRTLNPLLAKQALY